MRGPKNDDGCATESLATITPLVYTILVRLRHYAPTSSLKISVFLSEKSANFHPDRRPHVFSHNKKITLCSRVKKKHTTPTLPWSELPPQYQDATPLPVFRPLRTGQTVTRRIGLRSLTTKASPKKNHP